ncbi:hypothetical protein OEZ71_13460 [Defluviimonas sp. WL0050]|uniref:Uncharacterized protein n=1 Tax=Albidovulum litorale TaxID=2984134 RepID=A0ABT2ZRB8_9RHOB|nr:hypothetical protein [Defluviimonas sp. WL0050]MCV2873301.1 hypothetical protein [Defluviimonas sp. WL0050]
MSKLLARQAEAVAEMHGALDQHLVAVLECKDRIAQLSALPVDRDRAVAAVDAEIARLSSEVKPAMRSVIGPLTRPGEGQAPNLRIRSNQPMTLSMLAFLAPAVLRDALLDEIGQVYEGRSFPSEAERPTLIAKAEDELEALERGEELLFREAERAGLSVLRRADADPRWVLAHDDALQP